MGDGTGQNGGLGWLTSGVAFALTHASALVTSAAEASWRSHGGFCPGLALPCPSRPSTLAPIWLRVWDTSRVGKISESSNDSPAPGPSMTWMLARTGSFSPKDV
jgi:hypothetical protein